MHSSLKHTVLETSTCALCSTSIRHKGYCDQNHHFCCAGCQAVYQILSTQKALPNFQNHPLFLQAVRSGIISNPELLVQIRLKQQESRTEEGEIKKFYIEIGEMWCPSCAKVIDLILLQKEGILSCVVDYSTDLAVIEYNPRLTSEEKIVKTIEQLGYSPRSLQDPRQKAVSVNLYVRFIVAAFCASNVMMFAYPVYASYFDSENMGFAQLFAWLSLIGSLPVLFYSGWPIWRRFYTSLKVGIFGMEALVSIGVFSAFFLSLYELFTGRLYIYFDSMTVIIVFVLLGKIIESKAKFSAKDSLIQLTRGLPRKGRRLNADGTEEFVFLKDIKLEEQLVVLAGERIFLDGYVEEGEGACDESLMTGESIPLHKTLGSTVLAGSILQQGRLVVRVTAKQEETALNRIIDMVKQDIGHKSEYVRAIDQIVKWFVPIVVGLAILTAFYCIVFGISDSGYTASQTAIMRFISILLISCPCAIGIAAPLAESHLLNALAKLGAMIRNRGCLSYLGKEQLFVFDKTGTITEGKFTVQRGLEILTPKEKGYLKGLVACSNHSIAVAINQALACFPEKMDDIQEIIGKGLWGQKDGEEYILGSCNFFKEKNILVDKQENGPSISTVVYFAKEGQLLTQIVLGDQIRIHAKEMIAELSPIKKCLVSGDSSSCVKQVSEICGFDFWQAECHPLQKRNLIEEFKKQGYIVAMVGDGINDAPALATAHVGIAAVSATDVSIQVSDILLTTNNLDIITRIRKLAQMGQKIVKQNLFWAFFYNVIGIGLAMAGLLSPIFSACAMVVSSLLVLLNAQRIK